MSDGFISLGTLDAMWIRVGAAAVAGLIIGLERQLAGRPLGLRTGILVVDLRFAT